MLIAAVAALACLCLARSSPTEPHSLRVYPQKSHNIKDITSILASIEERLRVLDTVSDVQAKQARRLEVIQDKLDRVETTFTLKLERAQLAAERLEHKLHMLQNNVQESIKESNDKIERNQVKIVELTQNLTSSINTHKALLEKVNGAYADTWHRGLVIEGLMRDGLSLVNVTRRELADGLRALARRQRDARYNSADLEASFTRRLNDNTYKIDLKMQEVLDVQKRFVDSCQPVQQDDPNQVTSVLDKLFGSLVEKVSTIFRELQSIKSTVREHDSTVNKLLTTKPTQIDGTCRRLENAFRNSSHGVFKENELRQLTEKFVALTDRADAALQRLEAQIAEEIEEPIPTSDLTAAADKLLLKLKGYNEKKNIDNEFDYDSEEIGFVEDGEGDMMDEDKQILNKALEQAQASSESTTIQPLHRRHLHKHPYDRGPRLKPLQ